MDNDTAQKALERIVRLVIDATPSSWHLLRMEFSVAGTVAETVGWIVTEAGEERRMVEPSEVPWSFIDLREATYQQGKGAWYCATVTVHPDGRYEVDYDYDTKPRISFDVDPATFVDDLDDFPRDEALRPKWLKDIVGDNATSRCVADAFCGALTR